MFISNLCGPAILYIGFSLIQIIIDSIKNNYESALIKFIVMIVLSILLNILCNIGFSVISWFLVFIPIIMMTIMSTLTLRIFGLEPDSETIRSNVRDISNNIDPSGNYYGKRDYINRTSLDNVERIDRDKVRKELYDKVESSYDLNSNFEDLYDLSQNVQKYKLVDTILNHYGDNYFINKIVNSRLYNQLFNNYNTTNNINNTNNYNTSYSNPNFFTTNSFDSYLTNLRNSNIKMSLTKDVTPDASYSYANTNQVDNLFHTPGDGFFVYRNQVYNQFVKDYPNFSKARRDKLIENQWNSLSNSEQEVYNQQATSSSTSNYNPNNLSSYRSPLLSANYKRNIGSTLSFSAQCPPDQIKVGSNCVDTTGAIMSSLNNF
tara:strand:+ start:767 stop:1894 length:1128 start_codon:yes stop_codon:yes gene_type:complete